MTDKQIAEELANCLELISFDEEEISLEDAIKEIEDALEDSPYENGWLLRKKNLIYCEKEWTGSDNILIFGEEDSLRDEAILWWENAIGDNIKESVKEHAEQVLIEGFTNKTNEQVKEEWLDGEIDSYQRSPEDALSTFQVLQDLHDQYDYEVHKLDEELYDINELMFEVADLIRGLKKSKEKPSKESTEQGKKLSTLLLGNEMSKRQGMEILETFLELDESSENYQQELANTTGIIDSAYAGVKEAYDKKNEELQEKREEFKDWYRNDLPREIASTVGELLGQKIDSSYRGDMHTYLKYEYGFDDAYILENYFAGMDIEAYAEWVVNTEGIGHGIDHYDGQFHKSCDLIWVHY